MTRGLLLRQLICALMLGTVAAGANTPEIEWQFSEFRDFSDPSFMSKGAGVAIEWAEEGFLIGGLAENRMVSIVKLSTGGNFMLHTNFQGTQFALASLEDLIVLPDGSLAGVGDAIQPEAPEIGAAFVFRLSPDLDLMWWKDISVRTYKNSAKELTISPEGLIAISGFSVEYDMNDDGSFALLDTDGNVSTTNRYDKTVEGEFIRNDRFYAIDNYNGGFVMAGSTRRNYWVMAVDQQGAVQWEEILGESGAGAVEEAFDMKALENGGVILGGYSTSTPGAIKTSPHYGGEDYWVVRLDGERNIVWQRSYGGTGDDRLVSLDVTEDGGFVLGGWSDSPVSGNKTAAHRGKKDYWVIRTDAQGTVLWEETYGGSEDDELVSIEQTSDGGYIIGGNSSSGADGNKTKPETGWWIIKLAAEGAARLSAPAQSAAEIAAEGFRMFLSGEPGTSYVLERSADLGEWTPISTNLLTESEMELRDAAPGTETNFYRARTED